MLDPCKLQVKPRMAWMAAWHASWHTCARKHACHSMLGDQGPACGPALVAVRLSGVAVRMPRRRVCEHCRYYTQGSFVSLRMAVPLWIQQIPAGPEKHVAAMQFYYVSPSRHSPGCPSHSPQGNTRSLSLEPRLLVSGTEGNPPRPDPSDHRSFQGLLVLLRCFLHLPPSGCFLRQGAAYMRKMCCGRGASLVC